MISSALPDLLAAGQELDLLPYKQEMMTLFDLATQKRE